MQALSEPQVLLRIFINETDKYHRKPLYRELLGMFRKENISGATVLRGICGYGTTKLMHRANLLALSQDLPIIIEVIDSQVNIEKVLPKIDEMMESGLITTEAVNVVRHFNQQ